MQWRRAAALVVAAVAVAAVNGVRACDAHTHNDGADILEHGAHGDGCGAGAGAHAATTTLPDDPAEAVAAAIAAAAASLPPRTTTPVVIGDADTRTPTGPFSYDLKAPFYSLEQFPKFKLLQDHWEEIRDEAHAIKPILNMYRRQDEWGESAANFAQRLIEAENRGWVVSWDGGGGWLNYALAYFGNIVPGVTEAWAPKTVALLRQIPGIRVGGFSRLLPKAYIAPHTDTTGLAYRSMAFHLCLSGTASLRLGTDWVEQRPGKILIFDTTLDHEVLNNDEERIILYLDFDIDIFLRETEGIDHSDQASQAAPGAGGATGDFE
jgi:hypothetical protein